SATQVPQLEALEKRLAELKRPAAGAAPRPLRLSDARTWRRIGSTALSRDGQWFAYRVGPAEGDGEVIVRQPRGDKELKFPGGDGSFGQLTFSADSKWLTFTASPRRRPAESGPPAPGPGRTTSQGAPQLVLVSLPGGDKVEFEGVRRAVFSGESATHLALHRAPPRPETPTTATTPTPAVPTGPAAAAAERPRGSDLILRELATGN